MYLKVLDFKVKYISIELIFGIVVITTIKIIFLVKKYNFFIHFLLIKLIVEIDFLFDR